MVNEDSQFDKHWKHCPECGFSFKGKPAISRKDGATKICPEYGSDQAIAAFEEYMNRTDRPLIAEYKDCPPCEPK